MTGEEHNFSTVEDSVNQVRGGFTPIGHTLFPMGFLKFWQPRQTRAADNGYLCHLTIPTLREIAILGRCSPASLPE